LKVAVQCVSPLLQKSLELFLKEHLSAVKNCDIVIRDKKIIDDENLSLYIGMDDSAGLKKPFSKSQLFLALENLLDSNEKKEDIINLIQEDEEINELDILEKRITKLTQEYQDNIIKAIRAFHEK
jgi:hypothetical protein